MVLNEWCASTRFRQALHDLEFLVPHNVNLILVPKCESAEQIRLVNEKISELKNKYHISGNIGLCRLSKVLLVF